MEYIINVLLRVMYFEYFVYLGVVGGGLMGNMILFEYLVFFSIIQDMGICLKYDWNYGVYDEL